MRKEGLEHRITTDKLEAIWGMRGREGEKKRGERARERRECDREGREKRQWE